MPTPMNIPVNFLGYLKPQLTASYNKAMPANALLCMSTHPCVCVIVGLIGTVRGPEIMIVDEELHLDAVVGQ